MTAHIHAEHILFAREPLPGLHLGDVRELHDRIVLFDDVPEQAHLPACLLFRYFVRTFEHALIDQQHLRSVCTETVKCARADQPFEHALIEERRAPVDEIAEGTEFPALFPLFDDELRSADAHAAQRPEPETNAVSCTEEKLLALVYIRLKDGDILFLQIQDIF